MSRSGRIYKMDNLTPQLTYYRPSGVAPLGGTLALLLVGAAAGPLFGAIYAFVNHHDPLIYLNVLLALFGGKLAGWALSKGIRAFRIRSVLAALAIGIFVFLAAYVTHWFVYLATVMIDFETDAPYDIAAIAEFALILAQTPEAAWELIQAFNTEGIWSISGSGSPLEVKGVFLAAAWLAEALVLCYYTVKAPLEAAGAPYSERLDRWMEPRKLPSAIAFVENAQDFKNAVARSDYSALTTLFPNDANDAAERKYATAVLYSDLSEAYVTVENVSVKTKKKKEDVSAKNVVRYLKIPPAAAQNIENALKARPQEGENP
jgi:hypothetical protein